MAALPALRALPARHAASLAALPPSALLLGPLPRADHFDPPPVATFADLPAAGARACDNCAASASVFCRADAALLCPACDVAVHSANRLAGRHFRVPLPPPLPAPRARRHAPAPALTLSMLHGPADLALALQAGACIEREAASLALSSGAALSDACRVAAPAGEDALPDEEEETPELSAESAASMCSVHTTVSAAENAATQQAVAAFYARRKRLRAEALARFRAKRAKRSFAKKVRYECRKTLADQRPRVKGRFVNKNELGLYRKYGDNYHLFLHELADGGGTDNSAGSSILSDTPNSPGAQHAADEALYNAL